MSDNKREESDRGDTRDLVDLLARGLWSRDGRPWQLRLNNHALVEGYEPRIRRPYFPPAEKQ